MLLHELKIKRLFLKGGDMKARIFGIVGALLVGVVSWGAAQAQQTTVIRITHGQKEAISSGSHAWALAFKEAVEEGSHGKVEVRILGNNAGGSERQQLERAQNGINQMALVSEITQPFFFKPALVFGTPLLFRSSQQAWAVLDGPFGQHYNQEFRKATGVRIVGHVEAGYRSLFNSKHVIKTPADTKGMKIRVGENDVHMAMVRGWGASATPIPWTEVYTALQQKLVDGMENPPGLFYSMRFHEQQKFLTMTRHLYSFHTAMINERFFQSLPADLKQLVMSSAYLATTIGRSQAFLLERAAIDDLKKQGVKIYEPTPAEFESFRKAGRPPAEALIRKQIGDEWVDRLLKAADTAEKDIEKF
jgi:tripartite ATP-independent transporter DctP family solute receptor